VRIICVYGFRLRAAAHADRPRRERGIVEPCIPPDDLGAPLGDRVQEQVELQVSQVGLMLVDLVLFEDLLDVVELEQSNLSFRAG